MAIDDCKVHETSDSETTGKNGSCSETTDGEVIASEETASETTGVQMAEIEAALWAVRASACELLAFSLRYPTEELGEVVASGEWQDAAEEISQALGAVLPNEWAEGVAQTDYHDMRAEATRLFIGSPTPECSPYEGYWRAQDEGVQPLMFVNPHTMEVERFCHACGLGNPEGVNEPLDAISTEMELMEYLASLAAGMAQPVPTTPPFDELPGGSVAAAYEQFMAEHVMSFAPRLAEWLETNAHTAYYRAVGHLLGAFLQSLTTADCGK